jgi:hypothetical protein
MRSPSEVRSRVSRHVLTLKNGRMEGDERDGYLFIVASGVLEDLEDVAASNAFLERLMEERGTKRGLIDARLQSDEPTPEVRAAVWDWLKSERAFAVLGYLVPETATMKVSRVNMTAVSFGLNVRAFVSVVDAHRFVVPKKRSSTLMPAVKPPSSFPPAIESETPRSLRGEREPGDALGGVKKR